MSWNVHRKLQREREVGKWRTLNYSDINIISLGCSVDLPSVSGSTKNFIRFWNVLIYSFVSLKSLKALGRAALCDTNRFNVCTQEITPLTEHAQTFDYCILLTEPLNKARLSSWLGMSQRSSPQETFSGRSKKRIERMMEVEPTLTSNKQL